MRKVVHDMHILSSSDKIIMLQQPGKGYNSNKAVMGWITGGDMGS
jgi:hypothetical protein